MGFKSRNQFFDEKTNNQRILNLGNENIHKSNRILASNLIEEKATLNMTPLINLAGTTTKISYFQQILNSHSEVNINPINDVSDNTIEFECIRDLPVKFKDEISISEEGDDILKSFILNGSFEVLPNTILPNPNDYFVMEFNGRTCLYRVDNVTMDNVSERPVRVVSFHIDETVGKNFIFEGSKIAECTVKFKYFIERHLGTDFKPIIEEEEIKNLDLVISLVNYMSEIYFKAFFFIKENTFFLKDPKFDFENLRYVKDEYKDGNLNEDLYKLKPNQTFYDPNLIQFILTNSLLNKERNKLIKISHLTMVDFDEYDYSLFRAIEERNLERFKNKLFKMKFTKYIDAYHPVSLYEKYIVHHVDYENHDTKNFYPKNLQDYLYKREFNKASETVYNSPTELILEIISIYINFKDGDITNQMILDRIKLLAHEKNSLLIPNIYPTNAFYLYPILIYIANDISEKMFRNNSFLK